MATQHQKCTICNTSGAKRCASCHSAAYCSSACQKKDWPLHKIICKALKSIERPPGSYRLALLFPADSKLPVATWVSCSSNEAPAAPNLPDVDAIVGPKPHDFRSITRNELRGFDIDHSVVIISKQQSNDVPTLNACVMHTTNGMARYKWAGPVIAMRIAEGINTYEDMTAEDLRVAVDYFAQLPSNGLKGYVQGVKICCNGDLKQGRFVEVDVPLDHAIFTASKGPDIPKKIGLDIRIHKYAPNPAWRFTVGNFDNQGVTFLHLNANPHSPSWGWAPPEWQNEVGSVLLVRADRKPISPRQVEILTEYCCSELQPNFESSIEANSLSARQRFFDRINKQGFEAYFKSYKKEQMGFEIGFNKDSLLERHSWGEEKSPLDL